MAKHSRVTMLLKTTVWKKTLMWIGLLKKVM